MNRSLDAVADPRVTDYETDSIIQKSLRTELGKDVTLLTVAHRLQTIMDSDKIVSHVCSALNERADVISCRWCSMLAVL